MPGSPLSAPPELRARWYLQVDKNGMTVKEACSIFGMSRKTYYKWHGLDHGETNRILKRREPHPQLKIVGRIRALITDAKEKYNYGPRKMSVHVEKETGIRISPNAIYKFFKKRRLIRKPKRKQAWYQPMKEPYRSSGPGENVQLDVKYVPGEDHSWDYQFRFVDTVTNMQFSVTKGIKDARATIQALHAAERSFPFPIHGIQTDNGSEFRGVFHEYLLKRQIAHRYIPKRSAPWNGKVERANRSVDDEYYLNWGRPWSTIHAYTRWYNHERPHLGKGMDGLTPYQKYLTFVTPKCHP